jgi:hypothetical protein
VNLDLVNCAQLRICHRCRLILIKATDRGGGGDTAVTAGILIGEELCDHSSPGRVVSQWCY